MLKDAMEFLTRMATRKKWETLQDLATLTTMINVETGETITIPKAQGAERIDFFDLESFCSFLSCEPNRPSGRIYVRESEIVFVNRDSSHFCNMYSLPLKHSPVFSFLRQSHSAEPDALSQMLKFNLSNAAAIDPKTFVSAIGNLKFCSQSDKEYEVSDGAEGISKSLRATVTGEIAVPDSVNVTVEMYPGIADQLNSDCIDKLVVTMSIDVKVSPKEGRVLIRPMPAEVDKAIAQSLSGIAETIRTSCGYPVYLVAE